MSRDEVLKELDKMGTYETYRNPAGGGGWFEQAVFQTADPEGAYNEFAIILHFNRDGVLVGASLRELFP
jgi:hypothetical protein